MSPAEIAKMDQLVADSGSMLQEADLEMDYNNALSGHQPIDISHAGGEMAAMAAGILPR